MLEGLFLSNVSSGKLAQFSSDKLDLPTDDSNSLSLDEFSELFTGQLPPQFDLKTLSLLPEARGQSLPTSFADGTGLPLKTAESILSMLSDPVQREKLGLTEAQLVAIKDLLNSDLKTTNPALLNEKLNDLLKLNSLNFNAGDLINKAINQTEEAIDQSSFKDAIMDIVKLDRGQKGQNELLFNTVNHGQLPVASTATHSSANSLNIEAPLNPVHNQLLVTEHQTRTSNYMQSVSVDTQLGRPQWAEAFNSRVLLLAQGQVQSAHIKLNPAELGPVEIRVSVSNDHTNIHFIAQHGDVRDVIEEALPRLREMMGQTGVNLGDVNVSQHSASEQSTEFADDSNIDSEQDASGQQSDEQNQNSAQLRTQIGLVDETV